MTWPSLQETDSLRNSERTAIFVWKRRIPDAIEWSGWEMLGCQENVYVPGVLRAPVDSPVPPFPLPSTENG